MSKFSIGIIGNKPYEVLDMSPIIDRFDTNIRCNMATVGRRNGTKYGVLALCNHLHENLMSHDRTTEEFWKIYKHAYVEDEVREFHENFDKHKFSSVYYANDNGILNRFLDHVGCPHKFSTQPRTGYVAMLQEAAKGRHVLVSHFTVDPEEKRETYYVESTYESPCHSKSDELTIIRWLHENHVIDVSLCLLDDTEIPTFDGSQMQPTENILTMVCEEFGKCIIRDCPETYFTDEFKTKFTAQLLGESLIEIQLQDEKND